jgi:hypothetical protein
MDDLDDPQDNGPDDEGGEETDEFQCPSCRGHVHEETQRCPHCGDWIVPAEPATPGRRAMWILGVLVMILLMLTIALF